MRKTTTKATATPASKPVAPTATIEVIPPKKGITLRLRKPLKVDETTLQVLTLDLDGLTAADLIDAEKSCRTVGETAAMITFSQTYYAFVAAKAVGVPYDDILRLSAPDFTALTMQVGGFLLESAVEAPRA